MSLRQLAQALPVAVNFKFTQLPGPVAVSSSGTTRITSTFTTVQYTVTTSTHHWHWPGTPDSHCTVTVMVTVVPLLADCKC
jgi:hypothetical protein